MRMALNNRTRAKGPNDASVRSAADIAPFKSMAECDDDIIGGVDKKLSGGTSAEELMADQSASSLKTKTADQLINSGTIVKSDTAGFQTADKGTVDITDKKEVNRPWGFFIPAIRKALAKEAKHEDGFVKWAIIELVIYMCFVAILLTISFGRKSLYDYYFTDVHQRLFVETDVNGDGITFGSILSVNDFWAYAENDLLSGLYWEQWYNGDTPYPYEGYVFGESKMLGVPQMRQLKVKEGSCLVHDQFKDQITECFAEYSSTAEMTKALDATSSTYQYNATSPYNWSNGESQNIGSHWGRLATYEGSGYPAILGSTRAETESILADLKANKWLDRSTRAVIIDFNLYNANLNTFLISRLLIEFPPTGGVVTSFNFQNVNLLRYVSTTDFVLLGFDALFIVFILYYVMELVFFIQYKKWRYLLKFWTWIDIVNLSIGASYVAFGLKTYFDVTGLLTNMVSNQETYTNFEDLAYWNYIFSNMNAVNVFLSFFKFFKYLSFNKTMTQLHATISNATKDLLGFGLMFGIVFVAYTQLGFLLFGSSIKDFSTFGDSFFTLIRIILGDFDFVGLEQENRVMGPIFFLTFIIVVFFILLNMFLAILTDTYSDVKQDERYQKATIQFDAYFKKLASKLRKKRDRIDELEKKIEKADTNNDQYIDMDELREAVGETMASQLMKKFDLSNDHRISVDEKNSMLDALEKEKTRVNRQIEQSHQDAAAGPVATNKGGMSSEEQKKVNHRLSRLERSVNAIAERIAAVANKMDMIEKARTRHIARQESLRKQNILRKKDSVSRQPLEL